MFYILTVLQNLGRNDLNSILREDQKDERPVVIWFFKKFFKLTYNYIIIFFLFSFHPFKSSLVTQLLSLKFMALA